jgi:hypothetical protein
MGKLWPLLAREARRMRALQVISARRAASPWLTVSPSTRMNWHGRKRLLFVLEPVQGHNMPPLSDRRLAGVGAHSSERQAAWPWKVPGMCRHFEPRVLGDIVCNDD